MENMHGLINYRLHMKFKNVLNKEIDSSLEEDVFDKIRVLYRERLNSQIVRQLEVGLNSQLLNEKLNGLMSAIYLQLSQQISNGKK